MRKKELKDSMFRFARRPPKTRDITSPMSCSPRQRVDRAHIGGEPKHTQKKMIAHHPFRPKAALLTVKKKAPSVAWNRKKKG
jgi:hypothetical protein